jgi:hypothetical protein
MDDEGRHWPITTASENVSATSAKPIISAGRDTLQLWLAPCGASLVNATVTIAAPAEPEGGGDRLPQIRLTRGWAGLAEGATE